MSSTKTASSRAAAASSTRSRAIPARRSVKDLPTYKVTLVTPGQAERWLEKNVSNRPLRRRVVDRYTRDMATGNWIVRGDAIEFDTDGNLLNGQHRLTAVVKSGETVALLVGTNVPKEAQGVADSGATRTVGDQLNLRGVKNGYLTAAIARRGWLWDAGIEAGEFNNIAPTHSEQYDWLQNNPLAEEASDIAHTLNRQVGITPSVTGFAFVLFSRISYDDAIEFMARLADGANQDSGSPILAMRNRVVREKATGTRLTSNEWLHLLITSWNLWRTGKTTTKLQLPRNDRTKKTFPKPV